MPNEPIPSPFQKKEIPQEVLERIRAELGADMIFILAVDSMGSSLATNMCPHNLMLVIRDAARAASENIPHHDHEEGTPEL